MSRKYASMQEELAARKAAGEYGDLSQYEKRFFRDAPEWVRKSREDAARSQKISQKASQASWYERPSGQTETGRDKWSLRGKKIAEKQAQSADTWQTGTYSPEPGAKPQPARKKTAPASGRKRLGCILSAIILFALLPLLGAVIAVLGDLIHDFGTGNDYDFDYTYDRSYEETGELTEDSFYSDAEAFICDNSEKGTDEGLIDWYYSSGNYDLLPEGSFADFPGGRLIIWTECDESDDPAEVTYDLLAMTEEMRSRLDDGGYSDVPVGIVLEEADSFKLRLVMIDGVIHFASGGYTDLGE